MTFSEGGKGKRMALDPKAIRRYVENGGVSCPYCRSENLTASNQEFDENGIFFDCECETCLHEWKEHYVLAAITPVEKSNNAIMN